MLLFLAFAVTYVAGTTEYNITVQLCAEYFTGFAIFSCKTKCVSVILNKMASIQE